MAPKPKAKTGVSVPASLRPKPAAKPSGPQHGGVRRASVSPRGAAGAAKAGAGPMRTPRASQQGVGSGRLAPVSSHRQSVNPQKDDSLKHLLAQQRQDAINIRLTGSPMPPDSGVRSGNDSQRSPHPPPGPDPRAGQHEPAGIMPDLARNPLLHGDLYIVPYLEKINTLKKRITTNNEVGKFRDDELARVDKWEQLMDQTKGVLARCIEAIILPRAPELVPDIHGAGAAAESSLGGSLSRGARSGRSIRLWHKISDCPYDEFLTPSGVDYSLLRAAEDALRLEQGDMADAMCDDRMSNSSRRGSFSGSRPGSRPGSRRNSSSNLQDMGQPTSALIRSLKGFDEDLIKSMKGDAIVKRAFDASAGIDGPEGAKDFFLEEFNNFVMEGDSKKGNRRLVKALLRASRAGVILDPTMDEHAQDSALSVRPLCEERFLFSCAASDGSIEFIPDLLAQYGDDPSRGRMMRTATNELVTVTTVADYSQEPDEEELEIDLVDLFTSAMYQQQMRIPLVEILIDTVSRIPKLLKKLERDRAELVGPWRDFFQDICDEKKTIPREKRDNRNSLVKKMLLKRDFPLSYADLWLWRTWGDGYDILSRACRDNDKPLLKVFAECFTQLPTTWTIQYTDEQLQEIEAAGGQPLFRFVGIPTVYQPDAPEKVRKDYYAAFTSTTPGTFKGPPIKIRNLMEELLLRRNQDDMTALLTGVFHSSFDAVWFVLREVDARIGREITKLLVRFESQAGGSPFDMANQLNKDQSIINALKQHLS